MEFVDYPRINRRDTGEFSLGWKIPREYRMLIKKITPEFREGMKKMATLTQKSFGLQDYNSSYPNLRWDEEKGLTSIVVGTDCACVQLGDMNTYYFHNVDIPNQALAIIEMLSIYLNGLQILQEQK